MPIRYKIKGNYESKMAEDLFTSSFFLSCLSIVSIPVFILASNIKNPEKQAKCILFGGILNSVVLNTAIIGGITFAVLKRHTDFDLGKIAALSFGSVAALSLALCLLITACSYSARRSGSACESKSDALLNTARDQSWAIPLGLLTNTTVAAVGLYLGRDD